MTDEEVADLRANLSFGMGMALGAIARMSAQTGDKSAKEVYSRVMRRLFDEKEAMIEGAIAIHRGRVRFDSTPTPGARAARPSLLDGL